MAGKGISINFLADVRQFLRGTDDVEDALEQVSDSLDDAARDGDEATEKLERSFRDLTAVAKRESDNAGDALRTNMKRGADGASEALDQVKDDGFSNAKEVAASFDGSAQSIVDGFQGAAAEAFSGFGPAGAVAGLLAAAGLGLVTAEIQKQEEAAQRLGQYFADAYQTAAAEGRKYIDQATIQAEAQDILFNPERESELKQVRQDALELGLKEQTLLLARAGDTQALNQVLAISKEKYADATRELGAYIDKNGAGMPADSLLVAEQGEADRLLGRYEQIQAEIDKNTAKQGAAAGIIAVLEQRTQDAVNRSKAINAARADDALAQAARVRNSPPAVLGIAVDSSAADRQLQAFLTRPRRLKIDIEGRLASGQRVI